VTGVEQLINIVLMGLRQVRQLTPSFEVPQAEVEAPEELLILWHMLPVLANTPETILPAFRK
jgi:hypothetical protein